MERETDASSFYSDYAACAPLVSLFPLFQIALSKGREERRSKGGGAPSSPFFGAFLPLPAHSIALHLCVLRALLAELKACSKGGGGFSHKGTL